MRASVLRAPGEVAVEERPRPALCPDEVLVRIEAVGVCGSDVHYYREGRIGEFVVEAPLVLGHESAGTIVEVGAEVAPDRVGERVSIEPQVPCRRCAQCKAGRYNLCPFMRFLATPPVDGAFAELLAVPADFAHRVPDSMSIEAAALLEPLSVAVWANEKAGTTVGSTVLVAGAGPIGVVVTQVARALGAAEVIVSDPVAERREAVTRFGATRTIDPRTTSFDDLQVDAFIDASGAPVAIAAGVLAVGPAGHVVLVGMGADEVPLPVARIQNREIRLTGVFRYANTWPTAIRLVESGAVDLDALVTGRFDLDGVPQALDGATAPENLKVIVAPN